MSDPVASDMRMRSASATRHIPKVAVTVISEPFSAPGGRDVGGSVEHTQRNGAAGKPRLHRGDDLLLSVEDSAQSS